LNLNKLNKNELIKLLEEYQKKEQTYSIILEKLNEMHFRFSFDENNNRVIDYISSNVYDVLGFELEEYKKSIDVIHQYFHPDDLEKIKNFVQKNPLSPQNNEWEFIYRFYNPRKNKYIWIKENIIAVFDDTGKRKNIIGTARDITNIKKWENEKNTILENIDEFIYQVQFYDDGKKETIFISPLVKKLLGLSPKQFEEYGMSGKLKQNIHPEDLPKIEKLVSEKLYTNFSGDKKTLKQIFRFKHYKTGQYIWLEERIFAKYKNNKLYETTTVLRDITKEKKLADTIQKTKDQFKRLADATQEGILIHENGIIIECNQAASEILGYSINELLNQSIFNLVHPDYVQKAKENYKNDFQEPYELLGIKKDSTLINAIVSSKNITYGEKKLRVTTIRDISKEKQQENQILLSQKSYKDLFDKSPILLYIQDHNGTFIDVNKTVCELYGYSKEEIIGKTPEFLSAEGKNDLNKVKNYLDSVWKTGETKEFEFWAKSKNGTIFPKQVVCRIGEYFGRKVIISAGFDISLLKNKESQLQNSENLFRSLTENAPDIILLVNKEGKILYHNQVTEKNKENILNNLVYNFLPNVSKKIYKNALEKLFKTGKPQTIEFLGQAENPEELRWYRSRMGAIKNEHGEVDKAIVIATDINEVVSVANELKLQKERLSDIIENIDEGIYKSIILENGNHQLEYASDVFYEWFNVKAGDTVDIDKAKKLFQNYHPEDIKKVIKTHEKHAKSKKYQLVYRYKIKGQYRWLEETIVRKYTSLGRHIANFGIVRDITERMLSQIHLKHSEERYRNLFAKNLAGVFKTKLNTSEIVECNNAFAKIFGYKTRVELIGANSSVFYVNENQRNKYLEVLQKEKNLTNYKQKLRKKDGSELWVLMNVSITEFNKEQFIEGTLIDITDIIIYEKQIIQSQQNYKTLIETAPYGILIHDKGKIVYHNSKAVEIFDLDSNIKAINKTIFEFLPSEYHDIIKQRYLKTLENEKGEISEYRIITVKGKEKIIEVIPSSFIYENKKMIYLAFRDITEKKLYQKEKLRAEIAEEANKILKTEIEYRKQIEKQLKEARKFTQNLINSSLDMIIASDKNGNIIEFNKAAELTFGYLKDEIIGEPIQKLYKHKSDLININEQLKTLGAYAGEIKNVDKYGNQFISYLSASLLYDENGNVIGSMGVSRDITDIKEAEKQIRLSEEKYRDLFENAIDLIQSVNEKGAFEYVNKSWMKALGYTQEEVKNLNFLDIIHPKSKEHCIKYFNDILNKKTVSNQLQISFITKTGKELIVEGNISAKYTEDGVSTRGIFHDITERIKAEEKIKKSLKEKETLLKEIHHRVKNNLQIISSILNLQSSYVQDQNILNVLKESQFRIKSMAYIHESLYQNKDFSQINFTEYISNLSKNLLHSYRKIDSLVELNLELDEVFLDIDTSIPLGLIVNELLTNSLKYAFIKNNGTIQIQLKENKNKIQLKIADNGVGLPENFDIYTTETLGLQLVTTLVEQIDADLQLLNKKGTQFIITINKKI
jgi:PAS domain S-box-containing protein